MKTLPPHDPFTVRAREILEAHWQPEGYTVPSAEVYPHQWLWDSCFHAVVWAHLGEGDRACRELENVFAHQAADGFVPHMTYWRAPQLHAEFWGRPLTSCITQPPMYGHALAELARCGVAVGDELVESSRAGLEFFVHARSQAGLVTIVHPWESGCDDSPRWDGWCPGGWEPRRWRSVKGELVEALRFDPRTRSATASDRFEVGSVATTALVAFNARELATCLTDRSVAGSFLVPFERVATAVVDRWDPALGTFVDDGPFVSRSAPTLEALLPILVVDPADVSIADAVFGLLRDRAAFGGECGPAQVHRADPSFEPTTYWRGPAWPQLTYLFWLAARRLGRDADAASLRASMQLGAVRSGFAEYWHPDTGIGLGASPQSWSTLAAVMGGVGVAAQT